MIINDSLQTGTQIPFIERAKGKGWACMVLNTNQSTVRLPDGSKVSQCSVRRFFAVGQFAVRINVSFG